jgi:two-component system sensor histidine kinase ArlS
MNLKLRFTLLSAVWLILILILLNIFIYYFVIKITTASEVELLWNKSYTILENEQIHHPDQWNKAGLLDDYLVSRELIRIVDPDSNVINQVVSYEELLKKTPVYQTVPDSEMINSKIGRLIFVQMPIMHKGNIVGMLEIGRIIKSLNNYMQVLTTVLLFASGGAVIFSIIGGYFYTGLLLRPIHQLMRTMQTIQKSGSFKRTNIASPSTEDELSRLGTIFNDMIQKLEENFLMQQQFLADASHELRTPLTIIESYANLLKRWAGNDPKLREEAVDAIHSEAIRLKGMTNALLDLVTASNEKEKGMNKRGFDLAAVVESTVVTIKQTFERDIILKAGDSLTMVGDEEKIKQLLIILLDNAIKYSKEVVKVTIKEEERFAVVAVQDQGMGIPKKEVPRLFERFYRVDKARNRKTGGIGLGLAIAKQIVEMHQGKIDISTKIGVGTTVTVRLPKETPDPRQQ